MVAGGDREQEGANTQQLHQPSVCCWVSFVPSNLELIYTWESTVNAVNCMAD